MAKTAIRRSCRSPCDTGADRIPLLNHLNRNRSRETRSRGNVFSLSVPFPREGANDSLIFGGNARKFACMKALVTGASGGIGREIAKVLAERGCELVLCSRDKAALDALAAEVGVPARVIALDLSREENCRALYEAVKGDGIDILINNAGFGVYGKFWEAPLDVQLNLIDLNVRALHQLMQLFLKDFRARGSGYIMNVSSAAGFFPGPLMAAYYASKNYVTALSRAVAEELRRERSRVVISVLCPGPVKTGFNARAGVKFNLRSESARQTAIDAVNGMFAGKLLVVPVFLFRLLVFLARFLPRSLVARIVFSLQDRKAA